jgi:hypothetical protein
MRIVVVTDSDELFFDVNDPEEDAKAFIESVNHRIKSNNMNSHT